MFVSVVFGWCLDSGRSEASISTEKEAPGPDPGPGRSFGPGGPGRPFAMEPRAEYIMPRITLGWNIKTGQIIKTGC